MNFIKLAALAVPASIILAAPVLALAMDKTIPGIVDSIKEGSVTVSPNKKTLVDAKGKVAATEIDPKTLGKKEDGKDGPVIVATCNYRCAMITRRCFIDEGKNVVCINYCDKQSLVCE
jgi:hypothetical protein